MHEEISPYPDGLIADKVELSAETIVGPNAFRDKPIFLLLTTFET